MTKLISGRVQRLNVGVVSYSENQTTLSVVGISSFSDVVLNASVSAGGTTGTNGQYLISTGIGISWASFPTLRTESTFTATSGQDIFNVSYNIGFLDVFINGVRLTESEYTASNGTSVILNETCFGGETVDILAYNVTSTGANSGSESDTLDSVTSRGSVTSNNISVGILTATGNVYTDVIRRKTDNSTNTKIALDSGSLKLYAGNGISPKVTVNSSVGINTNLNVVGIITASSFVKSGGTSSEFLKADGSVDTNTYLTTTSSGSSLTGVVTSFTGSWTVTPGSSAYSFTVPENENYTMWMRGNIPNGICVWNATVSLTNTNVPVIGNQYGWYYVAGNNLVLTSIPSQIIGTSGSISTSHPAVNNTNVFSFDITNNSGSNATVYYGYSKI